MVNKIIENLSDSILCNWKINKQNPPEKYNILSVSFFYKKGAYKEKSIYFDGIKNIIKRLPIVLPNFRLRIYHDNTVMDDLKLLVDSSNENYIELYQYDIPFFRDEENPEFHKGTFGTILRFLPFYDSELHRVNKCIVFDIDNKLLNYYTKIIDYFDKNFVKFAYRFRYCYGLKERILCLGDKNIINYTIIASFIYQSISLPYSLLSNFLEELYIIKKSNINNIIENCKIIDKYEYGIDEIYINYIHLKYLYQNKIPISLLLFTVNTVVKAIRQYFNYIENKEEFNSFVNFVLKFFKKSNYKFNNLLINSNQEITEKREYIKDLLEKENVFSILHKYILSSYKNRVLHEYLVKIINEEISNYKNENYELLLRCILFSLKYINLNYINLINIETDYINNQTKIVKMKTKKLVSARND